MRNLHSVFPQQLHHTTFPRAMHEGAYLSTPSKTLVIFWCVGNGHGNGCEVAFTMGLICISLLISEAGHLSRVYWYFVYLLWRNVSSSPLPIFRQFVVEF